MMDNGERAHCYGWLKSSAGRSLKRARKLRDLLDDDSVEAFFADLLVEDLESGLDEEAALSHYEGVPA